MKKITIIIFIFCLAFSSYGQKDIPSLEAIISGHVDNKNTLKDRQKKSAANTTLAETVRDITVKYENIEKKLSQKIRLGYNSIEFAWEVSSILQETFKTPELLKKYADLVIKNNLKNPLYLKYYTASYTRIKSELERCQKSLAGGAIMQGNFKEKYDALVEIKGSIQAINYHLESAVYMIEGLSYLNMNFTRAFYELINDDEFKLASKQVADKIIKDYSIKY